MPRPSITPEQRQKMRSEIRAATIRVLRRLELSPGDVRGYEQVTIRDVIDEAGISIGTFYKYFKNRTELGQALWAEPVAQLKFDMQTDYDKVDGPAKKIRILLEHYVKFASEHERVFRGAFLFVRPDGQERPDPIDLGEEIFFKNLQNALQEGQKLGVFRRFDTREMAQIFWASIHGSLALPINLDRYDFGQPQTLSKNMIETLLALIAA